MTSRTLAQAHRPAVLVAVPVGIFAVLSVALVARGDRDGLPDMLFNAGVLPVLVVAWLTAYGATRRRTDPEHAFRDTPALHDLLTGLANRHLFADRVAHALHRRAARPAPLVVLHCDLDGFAAVNQRLGATAGDELLVEVAARIQAALRNGDTAARVGGDEFAVLLEDTDLATAAAVADRLRHELAEPFVVAGRRERIQISIGVAEAVAGAASAEEVLRNADAALVWAKDQGRSTVAVYEPGLHARTRERLALRAELGRAVALGQLVLHYQPAVELATGAITGFEALVRWNHPNRGLLPPAEFVPMAEQSSLILAVGSWILDEACRAGARLQAGGHTPTMSVNIAARQLASENFVEQVTSALAASGLPPDRLVLEITETVVLDDLDSVVRRLSALRSLGVRIAIDDFGTGYNSLSYLSQLPVDMLKVDKSFVDQVCSDEHGSSVAQGIIAMSRTMNLHTVAEGVELPEQASWLRSVRCSQGQGFLWSRAVDLDSARRLLRGGALPAPA